MENNIKQQTTFWYFLQNHKIEIPIIQRDYAQGRIGKEKLRKIFLTDLKNALDGKLSNNDKVLKLDFVYGCVENECLNPLDGQQRLTTLWLLHWFIAFKAGKLSENNDTFKRFSYETRTTSREFCKKLSDFELNSENPVVEQIQNQTWFFSAWKQDPTIQAMLHMLGGTKILDENKIDILDGIEEVFVECNFKDYWEKLIGENCPIVFYYLDLFDLKLSDDLYIKMNARGKALTNFENFKADLVGHIKYKKWEEGITPENSIAHKLDTIWTDIFWKYKSEEHKIDEIYFTFLKRYFLNSLITAKKKNTDNNEVGYTVSNFWFTADKLEQNDSFKNIWNLGLEYTSFDIFNPKNDNVELIDFDLYNRLIKTLDNFYDAFKNTSKDDLNRLFYSSWESDSKFRFIPDFFENPNFNSNNIFKEPKFIPRTITQTQRVVFHSICCYFANGQYSEVNFKQWLRVVWNIVENANINGTQPMIGAMRLIDDLAYFSHDIYTHLKERDISKDFSKEQMEEEKEKAKQILMQNNSTWENKIIEAEKAVFFNGSIRFLFRTNVNKYDWNNFDKRLVKAKLYFDIDGVTANYKNDAILLRVLISFFTEWEQFWGIIYDNSRISWKTTLIDIKWIKPISNILDEDIPNLENCQLTLKKEANESQILVHKDLVHSLLLSNIVEGCKLNYRYERYALYPPNANANWKKYVIGDKRNKLIFELRENSIISTDQTISGLPYFWGWELYFKSKINNKKYQFWNSLNELNENGKWEVVPNVNLNNLETFLKSVDK